MPEITDHNDKQCSMFKRLAAMFYDGLCLFSLFFLATLILVIFTNGEAIPSNNLIYDLFLFFVSYLYFVWHWVNGGRTLGMRAWHIKLINRGMDQVSWKTATARFYLALLSFVSLGLGFAWAFFDKEKLTFHDRYSNTLLINDNH
jgi:uncharacterized RDD family membrane protein YckC